MESSYYLDSTKGGVCVNSIKLGYNRPVSLDNNGNLVVAYEDELLWRPLPSPGR